MWAVTRLLRASQQRQYQYQQHQQPPFRSTSVLAALFRLRGQYQRVGGSANASSPASASHGTPSAGAAPTNRRQAETSPPSSSSAAVEALAAAAPSAQEVIATEALRLLNKTVRASDPLSDFSSSSPNYCVEVGKLLSIAAAFGASTTAGRVQECLEWTREHIEGVKTTRQIMSIAMPLLNLKDGETSGRAFFVSYLAAPLMASLTNKTGEEPAQDNADVQQQQLCRSAVISVYPLISKLLESPKLDKGDPTVKVTIAQLLEKATASLVESCESSGSAPDASVPLSLTECTACVQAMQLALGAGVPGSRGLSSLTKVLPVLESALSARGLLTSTAPHRRSQDVVHLLDALLKLSTELAKGPSASGQPRGAVVVVVVSLMHKVLRTLPSCVSTASARDLSSIVQVVNRVRMSALAVNVDVQGLLKAIRPQVFLLAETHNGQLRQVECSQLLSGLSRWEWRPTPTVRGGHPPSSLPSSSPLSPLLTDSTVATIPDDLISLLCEQFSRKMPYVLSAHLVPYLQALARMEHARRLRHPRQVGGGGRNTSDDSAAVGKLIPEVSDVAKVVADCCTKACQLARSGKLSVLESALVLGTFAQLRAVEEGLSFFAVVEEELASVLEPDKYWIATTAANGEAEKRVIAQQEQQWRHRSTAVLRALEAFAHGIAPAAVLADDKAIAARAEDLRRRVGPAVLGTIERIDAPKELISFFSALHHTASDTHVAAAAAVATVDAVPEGSSLLPASLGVEEDEGPSSLASLSSFPSLAFVKKARSLATQCTGHEVAQLALAVSQLYRHAAATPEAHSGKEENDGEALKAAAQEAVAVLLSRASKRCGDMSLSDIKRLLDALRLSNFMESEHVANGAGDALEKVFGAATRAMRQEELRSTQQQYHGNAEAVLRDTVALARTLSSYIACSNETTSPVRDGGVTPAVVTAFAHQAAAAVALTRPVFFIADDSSVSASSNKEGVERALIEQLVVLAYASSQLCAATLVKAREEDQQPQQQQQQREQQHNRHSEAEVIGPARYDDGEEAVLDEAEIDSDADANDADDDDGSDANRRAEDAMKTLFQGIAEVISAAMERRREWLRRHPEAVPLLDRGHDEAGADAGHAAVVTSMLTAKQLLMLVQSFEIAKVPTATYSDLLFTMLPELRGLAATVGPLEVSLLMNAMTRLGVWNARMMNHLAMEAVTRVESECGMRQCCSLLRGMQRSRFLPPRTYLSPRRGKEKDSQHLFWSGTSTTTPAAEDPLLSLSRAAVDKLDAIVTSKAAIRGVMEEASLEDLVAVVHVLSFFNLPPQPTFDTYYILALKKLCVQGLADTQSEETARKVLLSATMLASRVAFLRRAEHRKVASRTLARAVHALESGCSEALLRRAFRSLPPAKAAEFHQSFRTHWIMYGTDIQRVPLPTTRRRHGKRRRRRSPSSSFKASNVLFMCVEAFFAKALPGRPADRTMAAPLHQFWRVLAPLPSPPREDALVTCQAARKLLAMVESRAGGQKPPPLAIRETIALCDALTRCLCCNAGGDPSMTAALCQQLDQLVAAASDDSLVSPAQAASLLLAQSLSTGSASGRERREAAETWWCHVVQTRSLLLNNAVDALLAFAIRTVQHQQRGGGTSTAAALSADGRNAFLHAARCLVPRLGQPAAMSDACLPHLYRLLLGYDAAFLKACLRVSADASRNGEEEGVVSPLWDALSRSLFALARAECVGTQARRKVGATVMGYRPLKKLARTSSMAREVREIARVLAN